jgi:hypothetical protein
MPGEASDRPGKGGIFLEPRDIDYAEIDPPLRSLIQIINSQPWIKTYGCCAGAAFHPDGTGEKHRFYIGLLARSVTGGVDELRSWLMEANRLNGPTGLSAVTRRVSKHAFGESGTGGWYAHELEVCQSPGRIINNKREAFLRMIRCLETSWEETISNTAMAKRPGFCY